MPRNTTGWLHITGGAEQLERGRIDGIRIDLEQVERALVICSGSHLGMASTIASLLSKCGTA